MPLQSAIREALTCCDILDVIFACPSLSSGDLALAAAVQRCWVHPSQNVLYRSITTTMPNRYLARTMADSPSLRGMVRDMRITVTYFWGEREELLDESMAWMTSASICSLSVHCLGGLAGAKFARIASRWDMPTLRCLILEGYDFVMDVPHSVDSLAIVGFSTMRVDNMPPGLTHFRRARVPSLPHDVMVKYASTLLRLDIEFDTAQDSYLYDPGSRGFQWDWPFMSRLEQLTLISPEPLYLKLSSQSLSVKFMRISACLLTCNTIPSSVTALELAAPGLLTLDQAHCIASGGPMIASDHRLCRVLYAAGESSPRALINFGYGKDIPSWKGRFPEWDAIVASPTPAVLLVRLFWLYYRLWREPLDDRVGWNLNMVKDVKKYILEDATTVIFAKSERHLFPADPDVAEVPPLFEGFLQIWEVIGAFEAVVLF
ncbi:hypothetical protein AURDEDRAFT_161742 [Auricularia subglabra TFB-10046 SS5]|nr:hypothetical protein AURDEDRAFT_161742 [Auricularia subglabra TFB-10046 SS5]